MYFKLIILVLCLNSLVNLHCAQVHAGVNHMYGYGNSHADKSETGFKRSAEIMVNNLHWLQHERVSPEVLQANLTSQCSLDFQDYINGLSFPFKKWAIRMADSTGKLESGTLDGNTVFEGRHAQCVRANDDVTNIRIEPLYCYATWVNFLPTKEPTYITGLGFCIPNSCTEDDALILLETVYDPWYQGVTGVKLHCPRGNDLSEDAAAIVTIAIVSMFACLILLASSWDAYLSYKASKVSNKVGIVQCDIKAERAHEMSIRDNSEEEKCEQLENSYNNRENQTRVALDVIGVEIKEGGATLRVTEQTTPQCDINTGHRKPGLAEKLLMCFSLYQNVPLIVSTNEPQSSIRCLNGIRMIAMSCVVLGHTYNTILYIVDNSHPYVEAVMKIGFQKVATMEVYVDTFFILSAFLVTISFLKKLKRCKGKLKPVDVGIHYFNRYWRLTSIYMFVMMLYTNLAHYVTEDGPFALEYVTDIDSCATEWWKNMLYINTFWARQGLCMGVSWYLCVDMQLFVIAPLFLYLLYRWKWIGIAAVGAAFSGGLVANIVLWEKYYTQAADAADPVDSFYDIYLMTWTRCPVYFMGMLLGFLFYKTDGTIKMPKVVVAGGWLVALSMFFMCAYLPVLDDCYYLAAILPSCTWTVAGKVTFSSLYRPMWGIWVCWLITACQSGYGGLLNTFLSWKFFVPLSKLTFVCYLVHFLVLFPYYMSLQVQPYFTHLNMVFTYFGVQTTTYIAALILTVGASAPLMRLAGVFIPERRGKQIR